MLTSNIRKFKKVIKNIPNLLNGYNLYVSKDKFKLIDKAIYHLTPGSKTFADLRGVWNVNAAYTFYTLKNHLINKAFLIDTNFNDIVNEQSKRYNYLNCINGNFAEIDTIKKLGYVDVVFFFDVLLHQVEPDWDEVLTKYSAITDCIVIYNQQYIDAKDTIRLTELTLDEYEKNAPKRDDDLYSFIYSHKKEINKEYNKKWGDIHNIWQWGITDSDLRAKLNELGFKKYIIKTMDTFLISRILKITGLCLLKSSYII